MNRNTGMIEAKSPTNHIRRAYDLGSGLYGKFAVPLERKPRLLGLKRTAIQPQDKILEVAVGPGATLLEIVKRVDRTNVVYGVDLSPKMLEKAHRLVNAAGYTNIDLREADARQLPFKEGMFDILYNSYMLDLIQLKDMPVVLNEFKRVLKPGGRLVLVNFSKEDSSHQTRYESIYLHMPAQCVPYVLGGCRPVLMEDLVKELGFCQVKREFVPHVLPSEIVTARKPNS